MIRILFTKSNKIGSRIIRWGLEEPVSHTAIESEDIVLHSHSSGVDLDSITTFLKDREVVYVVEFPEFELFDLIAIANKWENSSYDYRALLWFIFYTLRRKWFGVPFPKKNLGNTPGRFLCTEVASLLLFGVEDGIITPHQLYLKLHNKE